MNIVFEEREKSSGVPLIEVSSNLSKISTNMLPVYVFLISNNILPGDVF